MKKSKPMNAREKLIERCESDWNTIREMLESMIDAQFEAGCFYEDYLPEAERPRYALDAKTSALNRAFDAVRDLVNKAHKAKI